MSDKNKLSTQPYKGVRDFYPEDMMVQNHIFDTWKRVSNHFGYEEYNASILEPSELYEAKSSEEIVNEQMYTFEDRGGRKVSLRPEMTPTVARLVAQRRTDYPFPLRWFSIANVFRYEKPQRGRLRDHMQLNVDLFGIESLEAELEMIELATSMMKAFGATEEQFVVKINSRKILKEIYDEYGLSSESAFKLTQTLDKKAKMSDVAFNEAIELILGGKAEEFLSLIHSAPSLIDTLKEKNDGVKEIVELIDGLTARGITNIEFDLTLARGFDYYTGVIFEIFDTSDKNPRSLFGGGRYSKLVESFGKEPVEAVGFGFGDVVLRDFLETYDLLPTYKNPAWLMICRVDDTPEVAAYAHSLAQTLRDNDINTIVDITGKKVSDQLTLANKKNIPFVLCIGQEEMKSGNFTIKNFESGEETEVTKDTLLSFFE